MYAVDEGINWWLSIDCHFLGYTCCKCFKVISLLNPLVQGGGHSWEDLGNKFFLFLSPPRKTTRIPVFTVP